MKKSNLFDFEQFREQMNCRELALNEKRVIEQEPGISETTITRRYVITKTGEKEYQLDIPLDVQAPSMIAKLFMKKENYSEERMVHRIAGCAKSLTSALSGPEGEKIILNPILTKANTTIWHLGMASQIRIVNSEARANLKSYPNEIPCEVIIHELLHLTGLVDEYEGSGDGFGCRAMGPEASVMNNERYAFSSFSKSNNQHTYLLEGTVCTAIRNVENCRTFTGVRLTVASDIKIDNELGKERLKWLFSGFINGEYPEPTVRYFSMVREMEKLNPKSVLEPAHFRAIIYPGCQKKNQLYYKCAKLAYKLTNNNKCEIPKECESMDWLR